MWFYIYIVPDYIPEVTQRGDGMISKCTCVAFLYTERQIIFGYFVFSI